MTFSSISLILKKEGSEDGLNDIQTYNLTTDSVCSTVQSSSADHEIGLIMTLSMSLLGLLLLFQGFLRDYVSFGVYRLVTYIFLCLTYLLFAIAEPGKTDYLQERINSIKQSNRFKTKYLKTIKSIFGYFNMPLVSDFISMKCNFWISIHQELDFLSVLPMVFVVRVHFSH